MSIYLNSYDNLYSRNIHIYITLITILTGISDMGIALPSFNANTNSPTPQNQSSTSSSSSAVNNNNNPNNNPDNLISSSSDDDDTGKPNMPHNLSELK